MVLRKLKEKTLKKTGKKKAGKIHRDGAALWFLFIPVFLTAGCPERGRLELKLEIPADTELNPLTNEALREVRLQVHRGGSVTVRAAIWKDENQTLEMGNLDPGQVDAVVLSGYSAEGRLLSYGRTGSFEVPDGWDFTVMLPFRRPLTYLSGLKGAVQVFDTSRRNERQILPPLIVNPDDPGTGTTFAATATPDGRHILLATHNPSRLVVMDTANHRVIRSHPLDFEPYHMGISRDGRWVVAADSGMVNGQEGKMIVGGLHQAISSAEFTPRTISGLGGLPPSGRPAFMTLADGRERVVMVGKRAPFDFDCSEEPSVIHFIDPYTGQMEEPMFLPSTARAVASSPHSNYFFVAMPCQESVLVVDPNNRTVKNLWVDRPMDIAVSSRFESNPYLFVGNVTQADLSRPARLSVTAIDLESYDHDTIEVSFFDETTMIRTEPDGTRITLTLEPKELRIWGMSLPPGDQKLSLLVYAVYSHGTINLGDLTLNPRSISTDTYVTLDIAGGEIGGRYRANCNYEGTNIPLPKGEGCLPLPPGQEPDDPFMPWGLTAIYGSQ